MFFRFFFIAENVGMTAYRRVSRAVDSHAEFSTCYFEEVGVVFLAKFFRLPVRSLVAPFLRLVVFANLGFDFGTSFVSLYWAITMLNVWRSSTDKAIGPNETLFRLLSKTDISEKSWQKQVLLAWF
jgi:hypothetical protein